MSVTQTFTVAEASVKHCPLVHGSCLTSRCMFWRLGAFARELSATECWHIVLAAPPGADCARSLPA